MFSFFICNFCENWKNRYDRWQSEEYTDFIKNIQDKIQEKVYLAIEKYPEIKEKSHACGLGRTFEEINKTIPGKVYPYLKGFLLLFKF